MAPRRGGSSGGDGDGGSAICEECSQPLNLQGSSWQDGGSISYLVLACISLAIYLYAARLCFKHAITPNNVKVKWMTRNLRIAVVFAILACCLAIVEITLYEEQASLTQAYRIEYIFNYFISSVAEFLLLIAIAHATLNHDLFRANILKALKFVSSSTLLAVLGASIACVVSYTLYHVSYLADTPNTAGHYSKILFVASLVYDCLYTALTLGLLILAGIVFSRSFESLKLRVFRIVLTSFLFLRILFSLIYVVSSYLVVYADGSSIVSQPNQFTYLLLGAICFALLGLIVKEEQVKSST